MTAAGCRPRWSLVLVGWLLAASAGAAAITVSAASSLSNAFRELSQPASRKHAGFGRS